MQTCAPFMPSVLPSCPRTFSMLGKQPPLNIKINHV
jgi:hypothetical protein